MMSEVEARKLPDDHHNDEIMKAINGKIRVFWRGLPTTLRRDIDDVRQELLIKCMKQMSKFDASRRGHAGKKPSFITFIGKVAENGLRDMMRHEMARKEKGVTPDIGVGRQKDDWERCRVVKGKWCVPFLVDMETAELMGAINLPRRPVNHQGDAFLAWVPVKNLKDLTPEDFKIEMGSIAFDRRSWRRWFETHGSSVSAKLTPAEREYFEEAGKRGEFPARRGRLKALAAEIGMNYATARQRQSRICRRIKKSFPVTSH